VVLRPAALPHRGKRFVFAAVSLLLLVLFGGASSQAGTLPTGFQESIVLSGLSNPTVFQFAPDGRVFVGEKGGVIKVFDNLTDTSPTTFADLRTNVQNYWDRGLLGLALHPSFPTVPYVYVLYTFDAPIGGTAPRWGDGCPNPPGATGDGCVVSGRLSRLRAAGNVMTGSEEVLIEDWCQQYPSHSVGSLAFGSDGALYVSGGEGASFNFVDYGQDGSPLNPCGDPPTGVGGVQTPPTAEGGALRSQDLRTAGDPVALSGTVLRLDSSTGAGFSTNALAGHADPNARRIIATGFRNPFRLTLRPGTNEVWIGDVGWNRWEEINRIPDPTAQPRNFGWPCYEGAGRRADYEATGLSICNNLYAENSAVPPHFTYAHNAPVAGETCPNGGSSTSGLAFYSSGSYPAAYANALFFADYSRDCIWVMRAGASGLPDPATTTPFLTGAVAPVALVIGPAGDLFYADLNGGTIRRIQFSGGNQSPVAVATGSPTTGSVPLTVQFNGSGSSDPDGDAITFAWDLDGDGAYDDSAAATPTWTYTVAGTYTVRLRVTDARGSSTVSAPIVITPGSAPNSPPSVRIDTPASETTWKVGDTISFSGSATDPEDGALPATALTWTLVLHHCTSSGGGCHEHPLQTFSGVSSGSFSAPDHEYPSHLELTVSATDSAGSRSTSSVRLDPLTAELTVSSNPAGLQLSAGNVTAAAPFSRTVIVGSRNSLAAPSPQSLGGTTYGFASWSDGGARAHDVVVNATSSFTATFTASTGPLAFSPTDDSYVEAGLPGTNYGASNQTVADADPQRDALLRFAVSGLAGRSVASAKLRIYCVNGSPAGGSVRRVTNSSWSESTVTWSNAPTGDTTPLTTLGAVAAGSWYEIDVKQAVTTDGAVSFRISSTNADGAYYSTKEGAAGFAPQLIVQPGSGPPDTTPPTVPTGLTATATSATRVDLTWAPSSDGGGIAGYRVRRDGLELTTVQATSYSDTTVQPATSYMYDVIAIDAAGNVSLPSAPVAVTTPAAPPPPQILTLTATDDTYIETETPTSTHGADTRVTVDASPHRDTLLRFVVSGAAGRMVRSAKLRLYCIDSAPVGGAFHRVSDTTWREGTVTWNSAPAADLAAIGTLKSVSSGRWYEIDVTSTVLGDGAVAYRIVSTNKNGADYRSKEGGAAFAPQLVVELQ
jgi:glucose/arabinose dehydrogenase